MTEEEVQKITEVVCPFCGSLCDDIEVDVEISVDFIPAHIGPRRL